MSCWEKEWPLSFSFSLCVPPFLQGDRWMCPYLSSLVHTLLGWITRLLCHLLLTSAHKSPHMHPVAWGHQQLFRQIRAVSSRWRCCSFTHRHRAGRKLLNTRLLTCILFVLLRAQMSNCCRCIQQSPTLLFRASICMSFFCCCSSPLILSWQSQSRNQQVQWTATQNLVTSSILGRHCKVQQTQVLTSFHSSLSSQVLLLCKLYHFALANPGFGLW